MNWVAASLAALLISYSYHSKPLVTTMHSLVKTTNLVFAETVQIRYVYTVYIPVLICVHHAIGSIQLPILHT